MDPNTGKLYDSVEAARADGVEAPVQLGRDRAVAEKVAAMQGEVVEAEGFLEAYRAAERAKRLGPKPPPVPAEVRAERHRARVVAQRKARQRLTPG